MPMEVAEQGNGQIVVSDPAAGHRFVFKLATLRGTQRLDAMAPEWAQGQEPTQAHGLALQAREVAEREARDQGWIEGGDPDVG